MKLSFAILASAAATASAKKVRKNVTPKLQMRAPFSILLALALLLGLQACDVAAAQDCAAADGQENSSSKPLDTNRQLRKINDGMDIYNPQFHANNVIEFDVNMDIVKKLLAEYEADVAPHREYSTDDICVVDPYKTVWKEQGGGVFRSNAVWYSPRNRETFEKYHRIVEEMGLEEIFKEWIDSEKISVLSMFFLTRDHSKNLNMHLDWPHDVHTQILSILLPIREVGVHFAYTDNDGNTNHHKYEVGKALGFGGGFLHSTDVGDSDLDDVIFNIYLAAAEVPDDPDMWWQFLFGTDDELQRYMHPSKGFVQHEWYEDDKDICLEEAIDDKDEHEDAYTSTENVGRPLNVVS